MSSSRISASSHVGRAVSAWRTRSTARSRDGYGDPLEEGLKQLAGYLERLGLDTGTLVIFDQRAAAVPFAERGGRERRTVKECEALVLRL